MKYFFSRKAYNVDEVSTDFPLLFNLARLALAFAHAFVDREGRWPSARHLRRILACLY